MLQYMRENDARAVEQRTGSRTGKRRKKDGNANSNTHAHNTRTQKDPQTSQASLAIITNVHSEQKPKAKFLNIQHILYSIYVL